MKWYRIAAEQGDADAQYALGGCYTKGVGVAKNGMEAVRWYRAAAEQGHDKAQYRFGVYCFRGVHVEKDVPAALKWWQKAAQQGNTDARQVLHMSDGPISGFPRLYEEDLDSTLPSGRVSPKILLSIRLRPNGGRASGRQ